MKPAIKASSFGQVSQYDLSQHCCFKIATAKVIESAKAKQKQKTKVAWYTDSARFGILGGQEIFYEG